ncbi:serine/threonine protein kinase [bacterium]|nr:serine/threonine protein kinase [bacterium]
MPPDDASDYIQEAIIWTGETAEIVRARTPAGRQVALKRIRRDRQTRVNYRSLAHEARVGGSLDHENVINVLDYFPGSIDPVMVMEFFPSKNLKVRSHSPTGDELLATRTQDILQQMTLGLMHVHDKGFIHMDIKPENYLLSDEGLVKLTDFAITLSPPGFFQRLWPSRRRIAGTRPYIAPETLLRRVPDWRTDIYSFGATVFELLTTRPPFTADNRDELLHMHLHMQPPWPWTYNKNLTREINDLVLAMLAKDPDRRPQNMADVYARLRKTEIYVDPPGAAPAKEHKR